MNSEKDREAEEARQRYRAQLQRKAFPTIGTVHSLHVGLNRAQRRAMKYKSAARSTFQPVVQQNIPFV